MDDSLQRTDDSRRSEGFLGSSAPSRNAERSYPDSLRRIVRRVLRTQRQRSVFEAKILDTARRLLEAHQRLDSRERLESMIVDELLDCCPRNRSLFPSLRAAPAYPCTQVMFCDLTFVA